MSGQDATRVAVLTPQGRAAVAVVAVSGPSTEKSVDRYFQPANNKSLEQQPLGRILFGRWNGADGEEVVVCRRAPSSVEVHCHGGRAACTAVIEDLEQAGCKSGTWKDFVAEVNADSIATAALIALAEAKTQRNAAMLLDQYRGTLHAAIVGIEQLAASSAKCDHDEALRNLATLLSRADVGRHLTIPWRVAIAGPPNVGKSSLINALVGYGRAIVFDQPGTTRDVVTASTAFDGWPIELADTAGLREATDDVETAGVARAKAELAVADLAILVFDLTKPWDSSDEQLAARFPQTIVVHNKVDLACREDRRPPGIRTSAVRGDGLDELERTILQRLVPVCPRPGDAIPFAAAQIEKLQALQARLADPQHTTSS